jgi:hypothetical protein
MDRYSIIYTWKILSGLVPNCGLSECPPSARRGRLLKLPQLGPKNGRYRTLKEHSYQTRAPRIWNSLPIQVRNSNTTLEDFKMVLDQFLMSVPDQPKVSGLTPGAMNMDGNNCNSIAAWIRLLGLHKWQFTPVPFPADCPTSPGVACDWLPSGRAVSGLTVTDAQAGDLLHYVDCEVEDVRDD